MSGKNVGQKTKDAATAVLDDQQGRQVGTAKVPLADPNPEARTVGEALEDERKAETATPEEMEGYAEKLHKLEQRESAANLREKQLGEAEKTLAGIAQGLKGQVDEAQADTIQARADLEAEKLDNATTDEVKEADLVHVQAACVQGRKGRDAVWAQGGNVIFTDHKGKRVSLKSGETYWVTAEQVKRTNRTPHCLRFVEPGSQEVGGEITEEARAPGSQV